MKRWVPEESGPKGGRPKISRFAFFLPLPFSFFFFFLSLSLRGSSRVFFSLSAILFVEFCVLVGRDLKCACLPPRVVVWKLPTACSPPGGEGSPAGRVVRRGGRLPVREGDLHVRHEASWRTHHVAAVAVPESGEPAEYRGLGDHGVPVVGPTDVDDLQCAAQSCRHETDLWPFVASMHSICHARSSESCGVRCPFCQTDLSTSRLLHSSSKFLGVVWSLTYPFQTQYTTRLCHCHRDLV